uniref:Monoglyceride lipase-like isoform X3 n=1 Tax=Crassostrea virginica TaxID=6565 RepID=A0A8B8BHC7_CRAVI|nr:monoglyceride lipase-like isoform X3 [Crassostrea virginica]
MASTYADSQWERFRDEGPLLWVKRWSELNENTDVTSRKGLLFISHGLGEHSGCYEEFASFLSSHGFIVFSHDHVGHGESHGIHNHVESFKEYTQPIFDHCDVMKREHPNLPLFLFGHSMVFFLKHVVAIICPQRALHHVDPNEVTRDPIQVRKIQGDPLFHTPLKARWGKAWHDAACQILQNLKSVSWPFFAIHGDADEISDVKFSQKMFNTASSQDKEIKIYPGFLHAPLFESEEDRNSVYNDIKLWLEEKL